MAEDADAGLLLALNLQDFLSTKLSLSTARPFPTRVPVGAYCERGY